MESYLQYKYASGTFNARAIACAVCTGGSCTPDSFRLMRALLLESSIPMFHAHLLLSHPSSSLQARVSMSDVSARHLTQLRQCSVLLRLRIL